MKPATDWNDERLVPVFALAKACRYEVDHTRQVTRLAERLFDELADLHRLDSGDRFLLTCAGLLHDIGWVEGQQAHHKTALRLVRQSPLLPWDERTRLLVGSIARYHRKALPKMSHDHYAALDEADRRRVDRLGALLRIADALDYSHQSIVQDVQAGIKDSQVFLTAVTRQPADIEVDRALRKGDLFERVFEVDLAVRWQLPDQK